MPLAQSALLQCWVLTALTYPWVFIISQNFEVLGPRQYLSLLKDILAAGFIDYGHRRERENK